jgi:hypothetical protein
VLSRSRSGPAIHGSWVEGALLTSVDVGAGFSAIVDQEKRKVIKMGGMLLMKSFSERERREVHPRCVSPHAAVSQKQVTLPERDGMQGGLREVSARACVTSFE